MGKQVIIFSIALAVGAFSALMVVNYLQMQSQIRSLKNQVEQGSKASEQGVQASPGKWETVEQHNVQTSAHANSSGIQSQRNYALEIKESKALISDLSRQNEKLLKEKLAIEKKLASLTASLARTKVELDSFRAKNEKGIFAEVSGNIPRGNQPVEAEVLDVNPDLNIVILNKGSQQGMQLGMQFSVVRGEDVIAKIKVIEVRDTFAGTRIIEKLRGWPTSGDRVIIPRK